MSNIVSIDGFDFALDQIPVNNVVALLTAAIGHKMRNETASKVVAGLRKGLGEDEAKGVKFEWSNPDHISAKRQAQVEMAETILKGEIGTSTRGSRKSPLEARIERLAREGLLTYLRMKKIWTDAKRVPKEETVFRFASGDRTFESLLEGYTKMHNDKLTKDAQSQLDREARDAAKRAKEMEGAGEDEVLGF